MLFIKALMQSALCTLLMAWSSATLAEKAIAIYGWPETLTLEKKIPDHQWASHPILGNLACPALTRMSLISKSSSTHLLKSLAVSHSQGKPVWKLQISEGLSWWSNQPVTNEDLAHFLKSSLERIGSAEYPYWKSPPGFSVRNLDGSVNIEWSAEPAFGPYILNELPFFRVANATDGVGFECTGSYSFRHLPFGYQLDLTQGFAAKSTNMTKALPNRITIVSAGNKPHNHLTTTHSFNFRFAHDYPLEIDARTPESPIACNRPVDFPIFSAIVWNHLNYPKDQRQFRKLLTTLIPRGTLLKSAAGGLGDLVSMPLLKAHPGYNREVLVRDFSIPLATTGMTALGLHRHGQHGAFFDENNVPLKLTLSQQSESPTLLGKILEDSLNRGGLDVEIRAASKSESDGEITSLFTPWPSGAIGQLIDSLPALKQDADFRSLQNMMERYFLSITTEFPDFSLLQSIHEALYAIEPLTVLMQHRACLERNPPKPISPVIIRNPDWFRQLVLQ